MFKKIKKFCIFDTSAIRKFSTQDIKKFSEENILHVFPYSFYEIICHLNDEKEFIDFKSKHLQKFQYVKILQDPHFVFRKAILPYEINENQYGSDNERILATCLAIEKSQTLNDFHNAKIEELNGKVRSCKNISINTEIELRKRESNFLNYANKVFTVLREKRDGDNYSDIENIYSLICAEYKDIKINKEQEIKIINQGFLHYSYIYFWLRDCLEKNGLKEIPISKKTRNSYEDSLLFMNLLLTVETTLIANDKELLKVASKVFDFVNKNKHIFKNEFNLKVQNHFVTDKINIPCLSITGD